MEHNRVFADHCFCHLMEIRERKFSPIYRYFQGCGSSRREEREQASMQIILDVVRDRPGSIKSDLPTARHVMLRPFTQFTPDSRPRLGWVRVGGHIEEHQKTRGHRTVGKKAVHRYIGCRVITKGNCDLWGKNDSLRGRDHMKSSSRKSRHEWPRIRFAAKLPNNDQAQSKQDKTGKQQPDRHSVRRSMSPTGSTLGHKKVEMRTRGGSGLTRRKRRSRGVGW
jgi:hypothetical protein